MTNPQAPHLRPNERNSDSGWKPIREVLLIVAAPFCLILITSVTLSIGARWDRKHNKIPELPVRGVPAEQPDWIIQGATDPVDTFVTRWNSQLRNW